MTKALFVCRALKAAGWRVVLVETYKYWHVGSRLSNAVDVFARVPIPELYPDNYKQAIAGELQRSPSCPQQCCLPQSTAAVVKSAAAVFSVRSLLGIGL